MNRRWALAGAMVLGAVAGTIAAAKPPVPPGRDPGGVAIAIVGPGIDYLAAGVAERLARDGEGEIVGFDLIDGDRRPFDAPSGDAHWPLGQSERFMPELLGPAVPSRLAVFRANANERVSMAQAIAFVAKSPARIVFLPGGFVEAPAPDFEFLAAASKQFPDLLFVVPAGDQAMCLYANGKGILPNVLVVTGHLSSEMEGLARLNVGEAAVDVATYGFLKWGACNAELSCSTASGAYSQIAAARIAVLAARVSAENAALKGAALKAAIVALAKPGAAGVTRDGVIEKTGADFRAQ